MDTNSEGLMTLNGQRCSVCGVCAWPPSRHCKACGSDQQSTLTLGPEAELYSITVDRMGMFLGRPHLVGQVRFAEGPFVQGFVDGELDEPPAIGTTVELVPFVVESADEQLVTYAFRPREG